MSAKATMQTLPCGHRVVCRKCFIKTIQSAIADHALPLKCIVCRASVLKLGSCKKTDKSSSVQQPLPLQWSATPSKSSRRTASSLATRTSQSRGTVVGPGLSSRGPAAATAGIAAAERPTSRSTDAGRPPPPEISSTAARFRESSSHRASHRGWCHHHQIPLRSLNGHSLDAAAGAAASTASGSSKPNKLQPLPIYPARDSAPTQRRAFSSTAATPAEGSQPDAKDCATSSAVRATALAHRAL